MPLTKRFYTFLIFLFLAPNIIQARAQTIPYSEKNTPSTFQETTNDTTKKKKDKGLPLKGERKLTFTTNEGSWLSLDVSPDGQMIVFDLLGDLYTLPITGGTAKQFTSGMSFDGQPRFSPDGKRIVFTSDRDGGENIWIFSLDKKDSIQVTKGKDFRYQSPEWTPDGKYVIASKTGLRIGSSKLWMYHVDGGAGVQLIKKPDNLKTLGAAFGKDPRYLWFAQRRNNWQYNAQFPQYQLAEYDRESGKLHTQTAIYGSAFRPTLSPDGKWLVYGTRHDKHTGLRIRDLESGDDRWLAYPVQHDDQESRATRDVYPGMSFMPDSKSLVAYYGGKIWRIPVDGGLPRGVVNIQRGEAQEIPFTVNVDIRLGPQVAFEYPVDDAPEFTVKQIRDAVPSPDGKKLAFTALDKLWVMDWPDGTAKRVTNSENNEHEPVWSPDGKWLAYVNWDGESGHIYKVQASGGNPKKLTAISGYYRTPAWSPDGLRIVMSRSSAQHFREEIGGPAAELVWVSANGGEVQRIAPTEGRAVPHFTQNADRIYFSSFREGLISMRWDGTDQKTHVKVTGAKLTSMQNPITASLVMMAPQGDQALAQVMNDIYIVTVPPFTGDTVTVSVADPEKATLPAKKLTEIGGQFPAWSSDGRKVHWSIGNAHIVYDLDAAEAAEDSSRRNRGSGQAESDSTKDEKEPVYSPFEKRIEISAKRDMPQAVAVLRGARVITMKGDEVIENADLVVRNNRLEAIGASGTVAIPDGAKEFDLSGKTIVPGYVDTHAHLRPPFNIHKSQVWEYLANLAYGVTTTRDPQTGTTDVLSYGDQVEAGAMIGPRIYSTGPGIFWQEGIKDLEHARKVMKRYSEYYDTKTIKMYVAGNRQQRQWLIIAAREQGLMPTTEGSLNLKMNLTQIIDGYPGHEHSFPIFPLYKDVIELVAQSKTCYTPTFLVDYGGPWGENMYYANENPHDDAKLRRFTPHFEIDRRTLRRPGWFREELYSHKDQAKVIVDLVKAGGRAGVGSHGQLQGLGYHWELWAMHSPELSNHDALRIATIFGAEAIGLHKDLGSIEPGKLADLVILDENPLDDIRHTNAISQVMKNGRLYDAGTLDEVWPRQKKLEKMWWWDLEPEGVPGVEN